MAEPEQGPEMNASTERRSISRGAEYAGDIDPEFETKKTLRIAGVVIVLLLAVFLVCSLYEGVRLLLCSLQLVAIGLLSCVWEEDSYTPSSSLPPGRRLRHSVCQILMVLLPIATGVWLAILGVNTFLPEDELPS